MTVSMPTFTVTRFSALLPILAKMGWSQRLADRLRDEEVKLSALKTAAAERGKVPANLIPHPKIIEGYLRNVLALILDERTARC
jgi:hypothetical protein